MNTAELDRMSIKDLREFKDRVDRAIAIATQREKAELKAKMVALAAEHGLSLADLVGDGKAATGSK